MPGTLIIRCCAMPMPCHCAQTMFNQIILILSLVALVAQTHSIEPIVIIPGLAATVLDATQVDATSHFLCSSNRPTPYRIWFSLTESVEKVLCLIENTRLQYDTQTNCTVQGRHGSKILAHGWGNTTGVEALNPTGPSGARIPMFKDMVTTLVNDHGYERGVSIRAAPYDFRLWGDACYSKDLMSRIQVLITKTYAMNNNSAVRLICHSMGCAITHKMLLQMNAEWKEKYLVGLVALAAPFAGAPSSLYTIVTGDMAGIPLSFQRSVSTWASIASLIPHEMQHLGTPIYGKDTVVLQTPKQDYTIANIVELVRDLATNGYYHTQFPKAMHGRARLPDGDKIWKYIQTTLFNASAHPGVVLDTVYVSDVPTPSKYIYTKDDLSDSGGGTIVYGYKGDGTVPVNSVEIPSQAWNKEPHGKKVTLHPLPSQPKNHMNHMNSQHMGTCWHPMAIKIVVQLVTGK